MRKRMATVLIAACWTGWAVLPAEGTAEVNETTPHWAVSAEGAALTSLRYDPARQGKYGRELVFGAAMVEGDGAEWSVEGECIRVRARPKEGEPLRLKWPIELGPEGFYDRITGQTKGTETPDHPAILSFASGAKGHTVVVESLKRVDVAKLNAGALQPSLLANPGGRTALLLTADGALFAVDHGAGGSTCFRFEDGHACAVFSSVTHEFTLRPASLEGGLPLESGARLPVFTFGNDRAIQNSLGGECALNPLFNEFFQQAAFWYPCGHGLSAWAAWGGRGHAYMDSPYRLDSRNALMGQVVGDDGFGHDGYAFTWGTDRGWPFPEGYNTRHFGINAMHICGMRTYLLWSGEYEATSGVDFMLRGFEGDQQVWAQEEGGRVIRLEKGHAYAQTFRTDQPLDRLALRLHIPPLDPTTIHRHLKHEMKTGIGEAEKHPYALRDAPNGLLAQRTKIMTHSFNAVGARCCCWETPGQGARIRVFEWAGDYAATIARYPLAEARVASVRDNDYATVSWAEPLPVGSEILVVLDEPSGAPGEPPRTGVWCRKTTQDAPWLYEDGTPRKGLAMELIAGEYTPPALDIQVRKKSGKPIEEHHLAVDQVKDWLGIPLQTRLKPGSYEIEVRPTGRGMGWEASQANTGFAGEALYDGHSWGWLDRARREMTYQMEVLNAREEALLKLDGKAGDRDHLGVTQTTVGNNYYDILPFGYYDAYTNAWFYASLAAMADLERACGKPKNAREYEAFMERCRARYNEIFWTDRGHRDGAARYIGCIDVEGQSHDYGFSFVNTLALTVGLAGPERGEAVLQWLDEGSSIDAAGAARPDIYHFRFGPRCTTIDNPDWWAAHQRYESYPWGDQIQNGGADLYESYYDILARLRLRGADAAYERLLAILERYAEPDRLTGGSPLFTGESVQGGGTGGGAGVMSYEFPETAILAGVVLYGFLGAEARADGLHLAPSLPSDQPSLRAQNILYHGALFDIEAARSEEAADETVRLRIACRKEEERFTFRIRGRKMVPPFEWEGPGPVVIKPMPCPSKARR